MKTYQVILAILLISSVFSTKQKDAQPTKIVATPLEAPAPSTTTVVESPPPTTSTTVETTPPTEPQTSGPAVAEQPKEPSTPAEATPAPAAKVKSLAQSLDSDDESEEDVLPVNAGESEIHEPRKTGLIVPKRHDDDDTAEHISAKPHHKPHTIVKNYYESHSDVTKVVNGKGTRTIKSNINGKKTKEVIKIDKTKPINIGKHNKIEEFD